MNAYADREQTKAKHFILRRYLQALAFKVLHGWDVAYVDGFSGPWESKTEDFADTSFMIAINVLKDAQRRVEEQTGKRKRIKCFFSEKNAQAFQQLEAAVRPHHRPDEGFEVKTYCGDFTDAVSDIRNFIGVSFPLIFIDPTGWTEYPFEKISPLFKYDKCEVLINFMYGHIVRFIDHPDDRITASLDPILGGPDWKKRLDRELPKGPAVEKLFRETLRGAGGFGYVVSTRIDKSTADRPHFFLAYGTKDRRGLKAFREIEYQALREHARNRSAAKARKREGKTGSVDLFEDFEADVQEATIDEIVRDQMKLAEEHLVQVLTQEGPKRFTKVVDLLVQAFMLRETNVKDICVALAGDGLVQNTWGSGNRKPNDDCLIALVS